MRETSVLMQLLPGVGLIQSPHKTRALFKGGMCRLFNNELEVNGSEMRSGSKTNTAHDFYDVSERQVSI